VVEQERDQRAGEQEIARSGGQDPGHHPAKPQPELVRHLREVIRAVAVGELRDHRAHHRHGDDAKWNWKNWNA